MSVAIPRHVSAAVVLTLLVALLGVVPHPADAQTIELEEIVVGQTADGDGAPLAPADGVPDAVIRRTSFGIPHVVARDWTSLGYGHGYATAEDSMCVLADTVLAGQGERSRFLGPDAMYDDQVTLNATNLQVDTVVTSLRDRGVVEALLADPVAGPSDRAKALVEGYVQGVNRRLADVGGPDGITDPACAGAEWVRPATALDLWYGVYLANLLASAGVFVPQIADATPPTATDPGTPVDPAVLGLPPLPPGQTLDVASLTPQQLAQVDTDALLAGLGKDPQAPFGSNGTALGRDVTTTGRGMVLGNPHFPWTSRYRFHQAQLTIPGVYDVAGASLHGSPVINIGWNADVAWTHTVSTGYRFTPYEYRLVPGSPTTYLTATGPKELVRQEVMIDVLQEDGTLAAVAEDVYLTDEGFVLDAPSVFLGWSLASVWALRDANGEHLQTLDAFLQMGEADSTAALAAAQDRTAGIPWVNTMAADRDGNALYADNSVVPHVTDAKVQQCATPAGQILFELAGLPGLDGTRAATTCAWGTDADAPRPGIFGPGNLPDTTRSDWVVNANDSYWLPNPAEPLEGFSRIIGCEECERTLRTRMVYRYVLDRLDGSDGMGGQDLFTHEQLQAIQVDNRVFGVEVAREGGDLDTMCAASGVRQEACDVLATWDGRSDVDSVGTVLFREFWRRTSADRWEVGFDADAPVTTPRDLDEGSADVQQALVDAVAELDQAGIPLDTPLGEVQRAGDDGALSGGIPIHGGEAGTGNANVVSVRGLREGVDSRYPLAYGSSHIQAVAFTDEGVDAATILTYGNAADPTSPHATDQTRLWSAERWVDWAFTEAEQLADPGYRAYQITGGEPVDVLTDDSLALDPAFSSDVTATPALRTDRVAAGDRVGTAVQVSRRTTALADTVVLAAAGNFPDALSGAPLAASLGAPLLLTDAATVDARVLAEVDRLGAREVILLGGTAALSAAVEQQLQAAGLTTDRIAGSDRVRTAAAVAERLGDSPLAFLADGESFADAVAAAGVAASLGAPVLLTVGGNLPEGALAALEGRTEVIVAGGPSAVPDDVVDTADVVAGTVVRAAGNSRYATAVALVEAGLARGLSPRALWVASGATFPDALAAGAAAGRLGTGVVLADPGATSPAAGLIGRLGLSTLLVAGGPAAVSAQVVDDLR